MAQQPEHSSTGGLVQYLSPDNLLKNRAFSQAVSVSGAVKTIYVGGQMPSMSRGTL